jgi:hypothetical protein
MKDRVERWAQCIPGNRYRGFVETWIWYALSYVWVRLSSGRSSKAGWSKDWYKRGFQRFGTRMCATSLGRNGQTSCLDGRINQRMNLGLLDKNEGGDRSQDVKSRQEGREQENEQRRLKNERLGRAGNKECRLRAVDL